MMASTPWDTKFSTWLSWVAASSFASTMLTVTPSYVARVFMPSWTRLRNVSLLGNATPMVTLLSVTGSGGDSVGAADAGASDPGAIDGSALWAIVMLETPRTRPATTVNELSRQAAFRKRIELSSFISRRTTIVQTTTPARHHVVDHDRDGSNGGPA